MQQRNKWESLNGCRASSKFQSAPQHTLSKRIQSRNYLTNLKLKWGTREKYKSNLVKLLYLNFNNNAGTDQILNNI